ncbi:MAG: NapC/NirT family cytochrome c [Myxococcales bacterium]|nr:NapC/NirT family cytochrome c [Myxococcales bacterium]
MLRSIVLLIIALALLGALVMFFLLDRLTPSRAGWIALAFTACGLPLLAVGGGSAYAVKASSSTEFCLECHEMGDYGRSLFIDDRTVLPATHYQNRLVERDQACFSCHTDYAMWGDMKAKLNGLKHVWVHYAGEVPETLELYQPYPNHNCLHCHDDGRRFTEAIPHRGKLDALYADETSCLSCHGKGHALEQVEAGNFWLGPEADN